MSMEQICILITILVYLAGMLYIGFYCYEKRRQRKHRRVLPGRQTAGTAGDGHERRGVGYEQLAADGDCPEWLISPVWL